MVVFSFAFAFGPLEGSDALQWTLGCLFIKGNHESDYLLMSTLLCSSHNFADEKDILKILNRDLVRRA